MQTFFNKLEGCVGSVEKKVALVDNRVEFMDRCGRSSAISLWNFLHGKFRLSLQRPLDNAALIRDFFRLALSIKEDDAAKMLFRGYQDTLCYRI